MKKLALLFVVAVVTFTISPNLTYAHNYNGKDVLAFCIEDLRVIDSDESANIEKSSECMGYIAASFDMYELMTFVSKTPRTICIQHGQVFLGQIVRVFVKYLKEHPNDLHKPAALLFWKALSEAFPCPESQPEK
jgi:hypothetical protein